MRKRTEERRRGSMEGRQVGMLCTGGNGIDPSERRGERQRHSI